MDFINHSSVRGKVKPYRVFEDSQAAVDKPKSIMLSDLVNKAGKSVNNELWLPSSDYKTNTVLYQWTEITSKLLTTGDASYRISGMYLEFETGTPAGSVSVPSFDRTRDVTYYQGLDGVTRDALRVPLSGTQITSEGSGLTNNEILFLARSVSGAGINGLSFSNGDVIFGASLIAMLDDDDASQDLLFSSFYFDTAEQQEKLSTSQVGIEWSLTLQ